MLRVCFPIALSIFATTAVAADANADFAAHFGDRFLEAWWPLHPDDAITAGYYKVATAHRPGCRRTSGGEKIPAAMARATASGQTGNPETPPIARTGR